MQPIIFWALPIFSAFPPAYPPPHFMQLTLIFTALETYIRCSFFLEPEFPFPLHPEAATHHVVNSGKEWKESQSSQSLEHTGGLYYEIHF